MATEETDDESVPHLWKECWLEQQLAQAPFAEGSQEAIVGERGQCHDDGNPKGFERTQDEPRWKCEPYTEAI